MIRKNVLIALAQVVYFLKDTSCEEPLISFPYVIVRFAEQSNFYEELTGRSQNLLRVAPELQDIEKGMVCKRIFGFNKVIEPEDYKKELKRDYETIFRELFKEEETKKASFLPRTKFLGTGRRYNYDNSSRIRTFLVDGREREENTLACVIHNANQTNNQFDMYFVSSEAYNVNDAPDGEAVLGRFIFLDNQIYAFAEQKPLFTQGMIRLGDEGRIAHIERRTRNTIAEKWEDDPVCKLDSGRKMRLCTYVCALVEAGCEDDKVRVEEPCQKRTYTYSWPEKRSFEEWMLTCKIKTPTVENDFYVARNYCNNEVRVFQSDRIKGEMWLRFTLIRVPVVIDKENMMAKL